MPIFGRCANSLNQYFPNDQWCAWVKDTFQMQERPMDFNVTVEKVLGYGFRFYNAANI